MHRMEPWQLPSALWPKSMGKLKEMDGGGLLHPEGLGVLQWKPTSGLILILWLQHEGGVGEKWMGGCGLPPMACHQTKLLWIRPEGLVTFF